MTIKATADANNDVTKDTVDNNTARIDELEMTGITYQNSIKSLAKNVAELNDTVKQIEAVENQQNETLITNRQSIATLNAYIEMHEVRLKNLETSYTIANLTIQKQTAEITRLQLDRFNNSQLIMELQSEQFNNSQLITDNTIRINQISAHLEKQNISDDIVDDLKQLESDINKAYTETEINSFKIKQLEANITAQMAFENNQSMAMDAIEAQLTSIQDLVKDQNVSFTKMKDLETRVMTCEAENQVQDDRILDLETDANINGQILQNHSSALADLKGIQIGFSARGGYILSGSNIVQFDSIRTSYGSGYSSSTGKFTCSHSGLYYFSVSLIKKGSDDNIVDDLYCTIYKNDDFLISTKTDPTDDDTDKGSYETSTFIVIHLLREDQVYVTCPWGRLDNKSSFSGFLVQQD